MPSPAPVNYDGSPLSLPRRYVEALDVPDIDHRFFKEVSPGKFHRDVPRDIAFVAPFRAWVEAPIGAGEWTAAYFLVDQAGVPVVAELRVFPTENHPARPRGEWSGRAFGATARAPRGGITRRLIQTVPLSAIARTPLRTLPLGRASGGAVAFMPPPRSDDAFSGAAVAWRGVVNTKPRGSQRGPAPMSDETLVKIAKTYAAAVAAGETKPVEATRKRHRIKLVTARDWIFKARERGLLSPTKQGNYGGELTARGTAILAALEAYKTSKNKRSARLAQRTTPTRKKRGKR